MANPSQLEPFFGKRVIVHSRYGQRYAGYFQRSILPGVVEVLSSDSHLEVEASHQMLQPADIREIVEASNEEEAALREACTCKGSDDLLAWADCPVHAPGEETLDLDLDALRPFFKGYSFTESMDKKGWRLKAECGCKGYAIPGDGTQPGNALFRMTLCDVHAA